MQWSVVVIHPVRMGREAACTGFDLALGRGQGAEEAREERVWVKDWLKTASPNPGVQGLKMSCPLSMFKSHVLIES